MMRLLLMIINFSTLTFFTNKYYFQHMPKVCRKNIKIILTQEKTCHHNQCSVFICSWRSARLHDSNAIRCTEYSSDANDAHQLLTTNKFIITYLLIALTATKMLQVLL